ncbi:MAG: hypothetical protein ACO1SV_05840 [Fimbriimonas sp.]
MKMRTLLTLPLLATLTVAPFAASPAVDKTPAEVVGEWRWGTINPGWFENKYTGAYEGHAGGTSAYFVFTKDGRFKRFVYIETNSYGWRTQVMTTTEGTVEFGKDTFRLNTEKGRYKSVSNRVQKHNFERPMTDEERAKDSKTEYSWRFEKDDAGKPVFKIGFTPTTLSVYKREK